MVNATVLNAIVIISMNWYGAFSLISSLINSSCELIIKKNNPPKQIKNHLEAAIDADVIVCSEIKVIHGN
jgi:hypothetical protein